MKRISALALLILLSVPCFSKSPAKPALHDSYLEVDYYPETYYVLSSSFISIELFGKTGTFNILCSSSAKKETSMLSSADLCGSTGFLLKIDDNVYRLNQDRRVARELRRLENGAQLVYTVNNDVRFVVDFSLAASREGSASDIIKVSTYLINIGGKNHDIGVKGIFDTSCGEISSVHFTTDGGAKIRNERCFTKDEIHRERTVISSDGNVSFQLVLDGIPVSPVESVSFANVDEFYKMDWESPLRRGRGFTSSSSYDNSAVQVKWPEFNIHEEKKVENSFYIAVSNNGEAPRGLDYVDRISLQPVLPPSEENEQQPRIDKRTDVEFIIPPIKDYQLDPGYIQDLIDRIDALQSSENVDKKTISRLNAELDAILEKLRRQ